MKLDMIAFKAEMERLRGAYIMDIAPACEMYRAALARAEAAEAEAYERLENMLFAEQRANDAANDATDAELHLRRAEQAAEQLTAENRRLAARVAELKGDCNGLREMGKMWHAAALVVGENLASTGPRDYSSFGSERWREWSLSAIAALRAAQQWRPVTEEWPPYGVQHLGRAMLNSPTLLVTRVLFESDMVWQDDDGLLLYGSDIRYCAAIPAPQEPTP